MKYCSHCGGKIQENSTFCKKCGTVFFENDGGNGERVNECNHVNYTLPQRKCKTCQFGLAFAIIGFMLTGLITSSVGLVQVKKNPHLKGKGLAIAGIVISILRILSLAGYVYYYVKYC